MKEAEGTDRPGSFEGLSKTQKRKRKRREREAKEAELATHDDCHDTLDELPSRSGFHSLAGWQTKLTHSSF